LLSSLPLLFSIVDFVAFLFSIFVLQACSSDTTIAQILLESHALTESINSRGQSALYVAVANGNEGLLYPSNSSD
jgi:hypothetical protein